MSALLLDLFFQREIPTSLTRNRHKILLFFRRDNYMIGTARGHGLYWNKGPWEAELNTTLIVVKPLAFGTIV
jgi:hypothetical protein